MFKYAMVVFSAAAVWRRGAVAHLDNTLVIKTGPPEWANRGREVDGSSPPSFRGGAVGSVPP